MNKELYTCDERLVKIFEKLATICPIAFSVVQGARTVEQARVNFKNGLSKLNPDKGQFSKHIIGTPTGRTKAYAVDICPLIHNKLDWNNDEAFNTIAQYVKTISQEMNIKIRWGGAWNGWNKPNTKEMLKDLGHFELV